MSIKVGPTDVSAWKPQSTTTKAAETAPVETGSESANPVDTFEKSSSDSTGQSKVYGKNGVIAQMWKEVSVKTEELRSLIQRMFGIDDETKGQGYWAKIIEGDFEVDSATQAEAAEMISEDGYFGVKQTTERLITFAKALGGENASEETIENLRDATIQGFKDVAEMFGGDMDKLPEVSQKTYEAVMKEFDDWKASVVK